MEKFYISRPEMSILFVPYSDHDVKINFMMIVGLGQVRGSARFTTFLRYNVFGKKERSRNK